MSTTSDPSPTGPKDEESAQDNLLNWLRKKLKYSDEDRAVRKADKQKTADILRDAANDALAVADSLPDLRYLVASEMQREESRVADRRVAFLVAHAVEMVTAWYAPDINTDAIELVKKCGNVVDMFYKSSPISRVFHSKEWGRILLETADAFSSWALGENATLLGGLLKDEPELKKNVLRKLFEKLTLQSGTDIREKIKDFPDAQALVSHLQDGAKMVELLRLSGEVDMDDNSFQSRPNRQRQIDAALERELVTNLEDQIAANRKHFDVFLTVKQNIENFQTSISTGRPLKSRWALTSSMLSRTGANQVENLYLRQVWETFRLSSSVPTVYFIAVLRNSLSGGSKMKKTFFARVFKHFREAEPTREFVIQDSEKWYLDYLKPSYVPAMQEAFDHDDNGFVNVGEVNLYTQSRGLDSGILVSLLRHLVFSAAGWHVAMFLYRSRIRRLLDRMLTMLDRVEVASFERLCYYLDTVITQITPLLMGISIPSGIQYSDALNELVAEHMELDKQRFYEKLKQLKFELSSVNYVAVLFEKERVEEYLFPVIYFILEQAYKTIEKAVDAAAQADDRSTEAVVAVETEARTTVDPVEPVTEAAVTETVTDEVARADTAHAVAGTETVTDEVARADTAHAVAGTKAITDYITDAAEGDRPANTDEIELYDLGSRSLRSVGEMVRKRVSTLSSKLGGQHTDFDIYAKGLYKACPRGRWSTYTDVEGAEAAYRLWSSKRPDNERSLRWSKPEQSALYPENDAIAQPAARMSHRGYMCDECINEPIKGVRYHCLDCRDINYDLCGACATNSSHNSDHNMMVFTRELPHVKALRFVFDARTHLKDAIQAMGPLICKECRRLLDDGFYCCVTCAVNGNQTLLCGFRTGCTQEYVQRAQAQEERAPGARRQDMGVVEVAREDEGGPEAVREEQGVADAEGARPNAARNQLEDAHCHAGRFIQSQHNRAGHFFAWIRNRRALSATGVLAPKEDGTVSDANIETRSERQILCDLDKNVQTLTQQIAGKDTSTTIATSPEPAGTTAQTGHSVTALSILQKMGKDMATVAMLAERLVGQQESQMVSRAGFSKSHVDDTAEVQATNAEPANGQSASADGATPGEPHMMSSRLCR